jgi:hypothetical protein
MLNKNFLNKKEVTRKSKLIGCITTYIPLVTYGCESWPLSFKCNSQLQAHDVRYIRKVEGKTKKDRIWNKTI